MKSCWQLPPARLLGLTGLCGAWCIGPAYCSALIPMLGSSCGLFLLLLLLLLLLLSSSCCCFIAVVVAVVVVGGGGGDWLLFLFLLAFLLVVISCLNLTFHTGNFLPLALLWGGCYCVVDHVRMRFGRARMRMNWQLQLGMAFVLLLLIQVGHSYRRDVHLKAPESGLFTNSQV